MWTWRGSNQVAGTVVGAGRWVAHLLEEQALDCTLFTCILGACIFDIYWVNCVPQLAEDS